MSRISAVVGTSLIILLLLSSPAFCHKMRVFAYAENDSIIGEAAFAGGRNAMNIEIRVADKASGEAILTTRTNDRGEFRFIIPEAARSQRLNLLIIADAGAGHRAEWPLAATDYLLSEPREAQPREMEEPGETSSPATAAAVETAALAGISEERIRAIVEDTVSRQLAPIKRHLAEASESSMSFQDILGGIGYIFGLAGLAAYMKSKKKGASHDR